MRDDPGNGGSFSALLRRHRVAAALTQEALAARTGLSARGISDLERGVKQRPYLETVRRLSDALGLDESGRARFAAAARPDSGSASATAVGPSGGPSGRVALPIPATPLIGRERDAAAISAMLSDPGTRLVTLTGPGGIGKTRLALELAHSFADRFADGTHLVSLADVVDPTAVASMIARVLAVPETGGTTAPERLRASLAGRHLLLILDNFEQVAAAATLVAELLGVVPGLNVLVTSREPLRVAGEQEYQVPPLGLSGGGLQTGGPQDGLAPAVQLFVARAGSVSTGFALTPEVEPTVAMICRRLDGLPLAIELAAARVKVLPPAALLTRLARPLALLTGGRRDLPARQRTMRDAIAWSYDLLLPEEQRLFRRLAVFVGGFTLEAAEAAAGDDGSSDVFELIASLADKSLLQLVPGSVTEPRYVMLEVVRDFGLERLSAIGESGAVQRRHAAYFLAFAEAVAPRRDAPGAWDPDRLDAEEGNLRAALAWAEAQDDDALNRLAVALVSYWYLRGRFDDGQAWLERSVERSDAAPDELRARIFWGAGWFARLRGDRARARAHGGTSLALSRRASDVPGIGWALLLLGHVDQDDGDFGRARARAEAALAAAGEPGDAAWIAWNTYMLGWAIYQLGDLEHAETITGDAVAQFRRLGDRRGAATALSNLGEIALRRGNYVQAARFYRDRLSLIWDASATYWCLEALAHIAAAGGAAERAARLFGAAAAIRDALGGDLPPAMRPEHEAGVAAATAALGNSAFAAAWAVGRQMSLDEARAEALALAGNG